MHKKMILSQLQIANYQNFLIALTFILKVLKYKKDPDEGFFKKGVFTNIRISTNIPIRIFVY